MHGSKIPIWFFIGVLLVIYGGLIFGYGIYEVADREAIRRCVQLNRAARARVVGATLLALGIFYMVKFRPGK